MIGTPRYLPKTLVRFMPSSFLMKEMFSARVCNEKKILDLLWFTFWPEEVQKSIRTLLMVWQFFFVALAKRIGSSAKKRCENEGPSLDVFMPIQLPWLTYVLMSSAKYSMQRMKMYGERGRPDVYHEKEKKGQVFRR